MRPLQYIEKLLYGKVGSVVAIEPSTGNILAIASSPSFDPNLLSGKDFSSNYLNLQRDTLKTITIEPYGHLPAGIYV